MSYSRSAMPLRSPRRSVPNHRLDLSGFDALREPRGPTTPCAVLLANGPKKPPPATSTAQVSPAAIAVAVAVLDFMLTAIECVCGYGGNWKRTPPGPGTSVVVEHV